MKTKVYVTYILSIIITLIIGSLAGILSTFVETYESLAQPPLAPPSFLFSIVWPILFVLMGTSCAIVILSDKPDRMKGLVLYAVQLLINACWSFIYFGLNLRFLAFIWIVVLIIVVAIMMYYFYKVNKVSAFLQIPYMAWLLFAAYLNFATWYLNM